MKILLRVVFLFFLLLPTAVGADEAKDAYDRGDYDTALHLWRPQAESGNALAQAWLGYLYENGFGVDRNSALAVRWYRKSAMQGNAWAQNKLGVKYFQGRGVAKSSADAFYWFQKAAKQGDADGQSNLGWMYKHGDGVTQNDAEAVRWFRKSADQGNTNGQVNLAVMYRDGRGVSKSYSQALAWYRKAAEQGDIGAMANIGNMYLKGQGVAQSDTEALRWYRKAADRGDPLGQAGLGYLYETGRGVKRDYAAALYLYQKSADQGNVTGQYNLAAAYESGRGVARNKAEALRWYKKAAAQGYENAIEAVAKLETKGVRVIIEDPKGRSLGGYEGSYALIIGVSNYTAGWPDLESVPGEMATVAETLKRHGFKITQVSDPDATDLEEAFKLFIDKYGYDPDSRLLFFFSGHGYTRKQTKGYLVPSDAPDPRINEKGFLKKAMAMSQILEMARRIESKHVLFLFDSCFSGTVFKSKSIPKPPPHITDLTVRPVRQFITAGSANEEVPAKSVFTPMFVRGLRGEADLSHDGYVTGTELGMYLHDKVLYYNTGQTPQSGKIRDPDLDEGDFVFRLP